MKKLLSFISLSILMLSCGSSKKVITPVQKPVKVVEKTPVKKPQPPKEPVKHKIEKHGKVEFFRYNISDIANNDNTISYGSIVTAHPEGYKISKDYFPSKGQNFRQRYIILHYTALDDDRSIEVLTNRFVSAHYLVSDYPDQDIYQLVDENKRAYHAGVSSWGDDHDLNDTSIGIEIVNKGYVPDDSPEDDDGRYFYDFKDYQIKKIAALVKDIAQRYNIPPTHILAHSDVAPTRKQDPGPKFPWKLLHDKYQLGMWYDEATKNRFFTQYQYEDFEVKNSSAQFIYQFQYDLKKLGYGIQETGMYDKDTEKVVQAFQYHFRPEKADGFMDAETYAILKALLEKYTN